MRSCFVLLFVSLLTSCEAQGTFGTPVFVLKGRDLLLKLPADPPEGFTYVDWKLNKTVTLVRIDPSGKTSVLHNVAGGFEFPEIKFSVILKNLQEADSGVYSAVAGTSKGDKPVAEYKVTVQGPVSPVGLSMDRVDSSSSESCDLHVTCRTHNSHINSTFRCVHRVCIQGGGERSEVTTSGASLKVYLLNSTIICNHSNQVHWTQDYNTPEHLCPSKPDPPLHYGWVIVICILALIMIVVLIVWLQRRIIRSTKILKHILQDPVLTDLLDKIERTPADSDPGSPVGGVNLLQDPLQDDKQEAKEALKKRLQQLSLQERRELLALLEWRERLKPLEWRELPAWWEWLLWRTQSAEQRERRLKLVMILHDELKELQNHQEQKAQ